MIDEPVERLADRRLEAEVLQPVGGRGARAGLALADVVAVDDEHVGAAAGQLPRHREAPEAGPADQHVEAPGERCSLSAPFCCAHRHQGPNLPLGWAPHMSMTTEPTTGVSDAKVVEGSDGLLLEIDGQIVPNYD